jgi:hypothetical protein
MSKVIRLAARTTTKEGGLGGREAETGGGMKRGKRRGERRIGRWSNSWEERQLRGYVLQ